MGSFWTGVRCAAWGLVMLSVAALPSRLANVVSGFGPVTSRLERALAGTVLDVSAALVVFAPVLALVVVAMPLAIRFLRESRWLSAGGALAALPVGFPLTFLTVTAQEMKTERGSFPTVFDLAEGGGSSSFLGGAVGFMSYHRILFPVLVGLVFAAGVLVLAHLKAPSGPNDFKRWLLGVASGFAALSVVISGAQGALAHVNRYSPAALGDPLTGLIESGVDLLRHQGPATARTLVMTAELPAAELARGHALLGWPHVDAGCELPRRPLDFAQEAAAPGTATLRALQAVSAELFADDGRVAVFFVSLEGFRADDVNALNPLAPKAIAPFTTSLYERAGKPGEGALAAKQMVQAGVRTAHNLGAMTCGLGTLPYNLAFIRDLQPFPLRCLPDVLADATFEHTFFYGSDPAFDEMHHFFERHRTVEQVTQKTLPTTLPKGTWEGLTDFAVFDAAAARITERLATAPQFAVVMSLSHHSPFTTPEDVPAEVVTRVKQALATSTHHADADDEKRLVAFSYTDAALERLVQQLDAKGIADRSIVIAMADHSTGHSYVWGKDATETDAQKAQVPFVVLVPPAFRARLRDPARFDAALATANAALNEGPTSLNDVPSLVLALLSKHPNVVALPEAARWHHLGGQRTSPYFKAPSGAALLSINGVSELFAVDARGERLGEYEDSVFLKTRADRYRVTPTLIPITAVLERHVACTDSLR